MIKIHIRSGKLTLMKFDDYINKPLPKMIQRNKTHLRHQDLSSLTMATPIKPPYLYSKSRFINEEFPFFAEQIAFEEALEGSDYSTLSGYAHHRVYLTNLLEHHRYAWTVTS